MSKDELLEKDPDDEEDASNKDCSAVTEKEAPDNSEKLESAMPDELCTALELEAGAELAFELLPDFEPEDEEDPDCELEEKLSELELELELELESELEESAGGTYGASRRVGTLVTVGRRSAVI